MYGQDGRKERRNPSVTPRKFNRFFTPRSLGSVGLNSARQALHDITQLANRHSESNQTKIYRNAAGQENPPITFTRELKRRKLLHTPDSSPDSMLPSKASSIDFTPLRNVEVQEDEFQDIPSSPCERAADASREPEIYKTLLPVRRIVPFEERGLNAQLLQMNLRTSTRPWSQQCVYPVNGKWTFFQPLQDSI